MKTHKYSIEELKTAIAESKTWKQVTEKLKFGSASYATKLRMRCEKLEIDFSHLKRIPAIPNKKVPLEYLLRKGKHGVGGFKLKNRMIEAGLKNRKCEICKNYIWQGSPLNLHLHHVDGNKFNNELCNLQILCPNCHSQTDTFSFRNWQNPLRVPRTYNKRKTKTIVDNQSVQNEDAVAKTPA